MKLIIDISEEELEIIRTNISKSPSDFRIIDGTPLQAELEEIKSEMQDYGCSFIIAKRSDLASAVSNCIRMVNKHIKEIEEK